MKNISPAQQRERERWTRDYALHSHMGDKHHRDEEKTRMTALQEALRTSAERIISLEDLESTAHEHGFTVRLQHHPRLRQGSHMIMFESVRGDSFIGAADSEEEAVHAAIERLLRIAA